MYLYTIYTYTIYVHTYMYINNPHMQKLIHTDPSIYTQSCKMKKKLKQNKNKDKIKNQKQRKGREHEKMLMRKGKEVLPLSWSKLLRMVIYCLY